MVEKYSKTQGITMTESRKVISAMSFKDYLVLSEDSANIAGPSGTTIGPTGSSANTQKPTTAPTQAPQQQQQEKPKANWIPGTPAKMGDTVGVSGKGGPNAPKTPGTVTKVNPDGTVEIMGADGKSSTHNVGDLGAAPMQQKQQTQQSQPNAQTLQPGVTEEIARMKKLAGISEDASCGATSAGAIATAPATVGKVKRRHEVDESPSLEHPEIGNKTLAGDTKPTQASARLSANLASKRKRTATRSNNNGLGE